MVGTNSHYQSVVITCYESFIIVISFHHLGAKEVLLTYIFSKAFISDITR